MDLELADRRVGHNLSLLDLEENLFHFFSHFYFLELLTGKFMNCE